MSKKNSKIIKHSFGIILCKKNYSSDKIESLIIQKRITYQFSEFMNGSTIFNSSNEFEEMTSDELIDILSLDFERMWSRYTIKNKNSEFYDSRKAIFYMRYLKPDGGRLLKNNIKNTRKRNSLYWEYPKGMQKKTKNMPENDLLCAMREFEEETGISNDKYKIVNNIKIHKFRESKNIKYCSVYYVAVLLDNIDINKTLNFLLNTNEIIDIKWVDILQIREYDALQLSYNLYSMFRPVLNFIKKRIEFNNVNKFRVFKL